VHIILPQALRAVIPVIVGQFIALFKDTTLVAIVGLLDLLGIANTVIAQPQFLGLQREVYLFVAAIFWVFCYTMAYASQRLEAALGVGRS
jgi:general L-amino acid transport system permease protein